MPNLGFIARRDGQDRARWVTLGLWGRLTLAPVTVGGFLFRHAAAEMALGLTVLIGLLKTDVARLGTLVWKGEEMPRLVAVLAPQFGADSPRCSHSGLSAAKETGRPGMVARSRAAPRRCMIALSQLRPHPPSSSPSGWPHRPCGHVAGRFSGPRGPCRRSQPVRARTRRPAPLAVASRWTKAIN